MEPEKMTACRIAEAVNRLEISAYRLIEKMLDRCNDLNSKLNLFVSIAGSEALAQADKVDRMVKNGQNFPLAGVPFVVKDDFCYSAKPTTYGSSAFKNYISPYNAAAVDKIIDAGAIIVGKTNLDGMSMGSTTALSPTGPARNPWAVDLIAGSAGAAAVFSETGLIALDSDSGGALRQGASHCGVLGLRPSMGRVSRYGLNAYSSSFGQVGLIASAAEDLSAALDVISGFDYRDVSTVLCNSTADKASETLIPEQIAIGWPENLIENLNSNQRNVFLQAREEMQNNGYKLAKLSINYFPEALRAYHVIACAEASSNLSRYDGIRFGQAASAENLEELYCKTRRLTFGPEAQRRSIFGTFLLSKDNFEPYYRQALKVWKLVRQQFSKALDQCDLLTLPVVRNLPYQALEQVDFLELHEDDLFCAPVSLAGLPSISIPVGKVGHLPLGLQLVGPPFSDELLIEAASRIMTNLVIPPGVG